MDFLKNKKIIDISLPVSNKIPVFPGDSGVKHEWKMKISRGDDYNLSAVNMGVHSGTHLDAPLHFVNGGNSIDAISPEHFIGSAQVIQIDNKEKITAAELQGKTITEKYILFKTVNSENYTEKFKEDFVHLTEDGARHLVEKGVELIGIDYLSVEKYPAGDAVVHRFLLEEEVVLLEGLNLARVGEGNYTLIALPLKITGGEGAPCRAVLLKD